MFSRYIGIDYSGAQTPTSRLRGLQVYVAAGGQPQRIAPPAPQATNWTRQEVAEWLIGEIRSGQRLIAGIDHGFSLPRSYFQRYGLKEWVHFLEDFAHHWPTDEPNTYVDFIRNSKDGPPARTGQS